MLARLVAVVQQKMFERHGTCECVKAWGLPILYCHATDSTVLNCQPWDVLGDKPELTNSELLVGNGSVLSDVVDDMQCLP